MQCSSIKNTFVFSGKFVGGMQRGEMQWQKAGCPHLPLVVMVIGTLWHMGQGAVLKQHYEGREAMERERERKKSGRSDIRTV